MREKLPKTVKPPRLRSPFVYPGGKSSPAACVWERFGNISVYVEPFFGTGAVLFGRDPVMGLEIVNDYNDMICNFWRAIKFDPDAVAKYVDWPAIESDKHARAYWLLEQSRKTSLRERLEGDIDYCDPKMAGYWVWVVSQYIGMTAYTSFGTGPWVVKKKDGDRCLVFKKRANVGISRQLPLLRQRFLTKQSNAAIHEWFNCLSDRLRNVVVGCGDWTRVCGGRDGNSLYSITPERGSVCGIFLDPPYSAAADYTPVYTDNDLKLANAVRNWAVAHGDDSRFRIALCGYEDEYKMPASWDKYEWQAWGGWSNLANVETQAKKNRFRERIWFSPHCDDKCEWKYEPSK